jgi:hypothetical protein
MAFVHGKSAAVLLDGADVSAYFNQAETNIEVDTGETTTFGSSWKTYIAGQAAGTFPFSGYFDPTWNDLWDNIGDAPGSVLTFGPGGVAVGAAVRLVKVLTASYTEGAEIGGVVTFDWDVTADGTVGFGRVIAASAAITADANGSSYDYTAQTTAGGIAHLHVFSVSASDSIDVTIEDSSTGSSGWATIGTFATKSAAGAERIAIAGTIKRYVRAVYDVTGTDVSIVCSVHLARL